MPARIRIGLLAVAISLVWIIDADACCRRNRNRCCPSNQCTLASSELFCCYPIKGPVTCKCSGTIGCEVTCTVGCYTFKYNDKCACHCVTDPVKYTIATDREIQTFSCKNARLGDLNNAFQATNFHGVDLKNYEDKCVTVPDDNPLKNLNVKQIFDELKKKAEACK